jgi:cell division protein ZapA
MSEELPKTKVTIFKRDYTVKGQADPEYLASLAAVVDAKMQELAKPGGTADVTRVAIMAAFNIADELMKARRALDAERQQFDQASRLAASLDLALQNALGQFHQPASAVPPMLELEASDALAPGQLSEEMPE